MSLLYQVVAVDGVPGDCYSKNIGTPKFSLGAARDEARAASVTYGTATVYSTPGVHRYAIFRNGNELPPEQW